MWPAASGADSIHVTDLPGRIKEENFHNLIADIIAIINRKDKGALYLNIIAFLVCPKGKTIFSPFFRQSANILLLFSKYKKAVEGILIDTIRSIQFNATCF